MCSTRRAGVRKHSILISSVGRDSGSRLHDCLEPPLGQDFCFTGWNKYDVIRLKRKIGSFCREHLVQRDRDLLSRAVNSADQRG